MRFHLRRLLLCLAAITLSAGLPAAGPPPLLVCGGGNLVPNPSFETYTNCPDDLSELAYALPWYQPTDGTPDWFSTCATISWVGVPDNFRGSQNAYAGNAYAGLVAYSLNSNYREYLQAPLTTPLVAGQTYFVSFRASLADVSGWAVSELGAHLSAGPVTNYAIQSPLPVVPQVENPAGNPLASTNGWMLVQGMFTASGGESFITLGNFRADNATTATLADGYEAANSYYYIDNVQVQAVCSVPTNVVVPCGTPIVFPELTCYDACAETNLPPASITTLTNSICPLQLTRTWTFTNSCGNSTNITQTIGTVTDTAPPFPVCAGTNMVPNGSFEDQTGCPMTYSQFNLAAPWFTPSGATPDCFDACSTPGLFGVPSNVLGDQAAFDGSSYAGAICFSSWGVTNANTTWREYLEVPLAAPMQAGQTYYVSFRVSLADACGYAIANLGAHFSVGAMTTNNTAPFPVVAHIANPANNVITSPNSWTLIEGYYNATGGENHLTLGNFASDAATTAQAILPNATNGTFHSDYSYYYFDDVQVLSPCLILPETPVPCDSPITFPTVTAYDLCSGTNVSTTIATVTNTLCPLNVTRTWTFTDLCGNSTNISQQVFATDSQPPIIDGNCILTNTQPLLFTNGCNGIVPNFAFLTNSGCAADNCGPVLFSQFPAAGTVVTPGMTPVTLTFSDCQGNSTNATVNFFVQSLLAAVITPPNIYTTTCTTSAIVNYNVTSVGAVAVINCTPPSGSAFPLGTNIVNCIMTSTCGQVVTNSFLIVVRPARVTRWGCLDWIIGIPFTLTNRSNSGVSSARAVHLPSLANGGPSANFENFATSGSDGPRFEFGAAEKFTFSTELNFNAATGAGFDLAVPPAPGGTNGSTLLQIRRTSDGHLHVTRPEANPTTSLRTIAIGTNGALFSSFTSSAAEASTNAALILAPINGATSVVMTVTLDCRTSELMLDFPFCDWTPDSAHKSWSASINGNGPRGGGQANKTARLILTPLASTTPAPITNLDLIVTNLPAVAFDNPAISTMGRSWSDGHVTILKAFNDGAESGLDFTGYGEGGGIQANLGHASTVEFRRRHFENGDIPDEEQIVNVIDAQQQTNSIRFTRAMTGVELAADFSQWDVATVTVQLWDGTSLLAETNLAASLNSPLVMLDAFPAVVGQSATGGIWLRGSNSISVLSGLDCSGDCTGDEVRILPDWSPTTPPPDAFNGLEILIGDGMDCRISQLATTPACTPEPIAADRDPSGLHLNWSGEGFRLQGAETIAGPWYDLGISAPVTLPANSRLRLFRLRCD
ncbi:MAG: hypothetical protein RLY20_327 [Verrucomicrobiota bacterium]|jgi:hypothetical protein